MRGLKARQQNAPSVEGNRAVETLAAFLRLVFFADAVGKIVSVAH